MTKDEIKNELKNEIKNRISLALKDPILQIGFELICTQNEKLKIYNEKLLDGDIEKHNKIVELETENAELKAKETKWHKVADGLINYPPCEKGNYSIKVLTNYGDIAYYDYNICCWIAEPASAEIDPPIAWCEIPTYTEEQK